MKITDLKATVGECVLRPYDTPVVTSPVGTMASVHLCASIANFLILEYHMIDVPWWGDLALTDEPIVQDRSIKVPEMPGLGIKLNDKEVARYLVEGETW